MSVCRVYESVHIKTGIDLFTRHKANITQISSKFIKKFSYKYKLYQL